MAVSNYWETILAVRYLISCYCIDHHGFLFYNVFTSDICPLQPVTPTATAAPPAEPGSATRDNVTAATRWMLLRRRVEVGETV